MGRIAAIDNSAHTNFHHDHVGFFGMFECIDDEDVAVALLEAAGNWLSRRGLKTIRGPMNFCMNDDFGCLLHAKDETASAALPLQPYNPRYYEKLYNASGLVPAKDFISMAWGKDERRLLSQDDSPASKVAIRTIRHRNMNELLQDLKAINGVYHSAWSKNWGFLPTSDQEHLYVAKRLRSILDPNLMLLAEVDGEVVGMILGLPDYNGMLRALRGRMLPWRLPQAMRALRQSRTAVMVAFGIRPSWQGSGLADRLLDEVQLRNHRYDRFETNWILEDNKRVQHLVRNRYSAQPVRRFRVFERGI